MPSTTPSNDSGSEACIVCETAPVARNERCVICADDFDAAERMDGPFDDPVFFREDGSVR